MYIPSLSFTTLLLTSTINAFTLLPSQSYTTGIHRIHNHPQQHVDSPTTITTITTTATTTSTRLRSSSTESEIDEAQTTPKKTKKLTLLTFDLDDTLYPISTILDEANMAFARIMKNYGFDDIEPAQIVNTGRIIRERMAETDPEKSACLSHTETRRLAIREEMEKLVYQRKLEACADDWATQVTSLSPLVVQNAKT